MLQNSTEVPCSVFPEAATLAWRDNLCKFLIVWPVLSWGFWLYLGPMGLSIGRSGPESAGVTLWMALVTTLLFFPLVPWRLKTMQAFFGRAVEVEGLVYSVEITKNTTTVGYTYDFRGTSYSMTRDMGVAQATDLAQHDVVTVVLDPERPKRSFLLQQFT